MSEGRSPQPNSAAANVVLARSNSRIPLSLGKASLRIRLEAYYSLIAPEILSDRTVWLRKYDQIYEKVSIQYWTQVIYSSLHQSSTFRYDDCRIETLGEFETYSNSVQLCVAYNPSMEEPIRENEN